MTSFDLLMALKDGPLSSVFPVHVTSIIRAVPVASHGLSKEPIPVEPSGQSCLGSGGGVLATGGGGGGVGIGGALFAGSGLGAASSLLQPVRQAAMTTTALENCATVDMRSDTNTNGRSDVE